MLSIDSEPDKLHIRWNEATRMLSHTLEPPVIIQQTYNDRPEWG